MAHKARPTDPVVLGQRILTHLVDQPWIPHDTETLVLALAYAGAKMLGGTANDKGTVHDVALRFAGCAHEVFDGRKPRKARKARK